MRLLDRPQVHYGYCKCCHRKAEHLRFFHNPFLRWCDQITRHFITSLGVGPWHCADCQNINYLLPRSEVPKNQVEGHSDIVQDYMEGHAGAYGEGFGDSEGLDHDLDHDAFPRSDFHAADENDAVEIAAGNTVEIVGNVELSKDSLVAQSKRSRKFTREFRQKCVAKMLSGYRTPSQLAREFELEESDLLDWVLREYREHIESFCEDFEHPFFDEETEPDSNEFKLPSNSLPPNRSEEIFDA